MLRKAISLVEQGHIPDVFTRIAINGIIAQRCRQERKRYRNKSAMPEFLKQMQQSPLSVNTNDANQQHYEVTTDFYDLVLGEHKKYSSALFMPGITELSQAEAAMLALTCEHAELDDAQTILELGCGWGSLTLWMAEHYPACQITAVSNSATQKDYIDKAAEKRDLVNVTVITCDMNDFEPEGRFDRVVSVEMFEHMRNHELLFNRISQWLTADGKLFFHVFCHQLFPYFYESESESDWMSENFFSGGMMPSWDLPLQFQEKLILEDRWALSGQHYAKTCAAWLANCDRFKTQILAIFSHSPDPATPIVQFHRWRMFFMACERLFAYNNGSEWFVGHYRFRNKNTLPSSSSDQVSAAGDE
ncbi:MAG: cyclopropane-fatty-acyl-phospholipid synthase [Candidatus Pseudothioglobus sp.]|jgi:cyclopropane-fatty-acyl-phospholipid synthase